MKLTRRVSGRRAVVLGGIVASAVMLAAATAWACTVNDDVLTTASSTSFPDSPSDEKTLNMGTASAPGTSGVLVADTYYPKVRPPDLLTVCEHMPWSGNTWNGGSAQGATVSSPGGNISSRSVTVGWDPDYAMFGGDGGVCWSDDLTGSGGQGMGHASSELTVTFA